MVFGGLFVEEAISCNSCCAWCSGVDREVEAFVGVRFGRSWPAASQPGWCKNGTFVKDKCTGQPERTSKCLIWEGVEAIAVCVSLVG